MQSTRMNTDDHAMSRNFDFVAPGVFGMRIVMVNVYAIAQDEGNWVLIDTGLPMAAKRIRYWTERHFGVNSRPKAILLTHGHFDHAGNARELADYWDVPLYAHRMEMPYLTGKSAYPPPDPVVGGGLLAWSSCVMPRGPMNLGTRMKELPGDGTVPHMEGWRWLHTPGHTPGHVSFYRESDCVLIAGDAFVTTRQESLSAVIGQRPEINGPPSYFTSDWGAARASVANLAALRPEVLATGHGTPMAGPEALKELEALASHFDDWVLPARGRYVGHPAIADENGVRAIPPPAPLPKAQKAVLTAAVLGAATWLTWARRKNS